MKKTQIISIVIGIFVACVGYFVFNFATDQKSPWSLKFGLDLSGGTHFVYEADVSKLKPEDIGGAMNSLKSVIERRINAFGVGEPLVQVETSGIGAQKHRLIVELPGVTDTKKAIDMIGKTPQLEFKLIDESKIASMSTTTNKATTSSSITTESAEYAFVDTGLNGRLLKTASLQFSQPQTGGQVSPVISVEFNKEGAELFAKITKENIGKQLAIILDNNVLSAPVIQSEIIDGKGQITGQFTPQEAKELARSLSLGALPVPIKLVTTEYIGAALGEDVKNDGAYAGFVGMILIALFLIIRYRLPGLVASVALFAYVLLMAALFMFFGVVLTSAGIAGFILSIGLAVDANVLIFERMKEEFASGSGDMATVIKHSFQRAWNSIRDGNISSLISAVILYWTGSSVVKGFAIAFGLGVIVSVVSAVIITRTFLLAIAPAHYKSGKVPFWFQIGLGKEK